MKNIIKGAIVGIFLMMLAGCRNQVNRDFLNRLVDLQENSTVTADFSITDLGLLNNSGAGMFGPYLEAILAELKYEVVMEKDQENPTTLSLQMGVDALGSSQPILSGIIDSGHFLLGVPPYLQLQALTGNVSQPGIAIEQLRADHVGKWVMMESETIEVDEKELLQQMGDLRKEFLALDPALFTEDDSTMTVTLGTEELEALFTPFLQEGSLIEEDATAEAKLTLGKETDTLSIAITIDQLELEALTAFGFEIEADFTNPDVTVSVPTEEDRVSQGQLDALLDPINPSSTPIGYTEPIFEDVRKRIAATRETLNRETGQELLEAYALLLNEEQYKQIQSVIDIPTLPTRYKQPETEPSTTQPHSDIGISEERFNSLIDSVITYRDNHTKQSAQNTLDQYYGLLTEEQYQELEAALDIESLPE